MRVYLSLLLAVSAVSAWGQTIVAKPFISGLTYPIQYVQNSQRADYGYVAQLGGQIKLAIGGVVQPTLVMKVSSIISSDGEGGLLGMCLDPNFATNRYFYLNVTTNATTQTHIWRFTMSTDGKTASLATKRNVITIGQPYSNHNGGSIHFGNDGYLYIGMGDGGGGNDQDLRAQDPNQLLGKFLRIDPNHDDFPTDAEKNYAIPPTNPFVGNDAYGLLDEIWSIGVRNPFRWSFDSLTGAMLIGDVGQGQYEEIDYEPAGRGGRNYGWNQREGRHDTGLPGSLLFPTTIDPFLERNHDFAQAIIGGFVYRGTALGSGYYGRYFFGDEVLGKVWSAPVQLNGSGEAIATDASIREHTASISSSLPGALVNPVSFDPDAAGEVVVTDLSSGRMFKLALSSRVYVAERITPTYGTYASGNIASLRNVDGDMYQVTSRAATGLGQMAAFTVNFHLDRDSRQFSSMQLSTALATATGGVADIYAYDWVAKKWVVISTYNCGASLTSKVLPITLGSVYFSSANTISFLVRGHANAAPTPFAFRADRFFLLAYL